RLAVPLAECLIGAVVLWRSPGVSQRSLRLWELAHFGILAAYCAYSRFVTLAYVDGGRATHLALLLWGAVTLCGVLPLILAHGVLPPHPRGRGLLVVAPLTAVRFVPIAAAAVATPALRETGLVPLVMQNVFVLIFPSAIAVFAAARAAALQRRAFEAERRA